MLPSLFHNGPMKKILVMVALVLIAASQTWAQSFDDNVWWSWVRLQGEFDSPFNAQVEDDLLVGQFEYQHRLNHNMRAYDATMLQPMVGYKLKDNSTVWIGYGYFEFDGNGQPFFEHRPFQMITYDKKLNKKSLMFIGNTRLEERFLEDSDQVVFRLRQMMGISFHLFKIKKTQVSSVINTEVFWNFNRNNRVAKTGFDQNRFLAGLMIRPAVAQSRLQVNLGYMVHSFRNETNNQGINLGIIYNLNKR